MPRNKRGSSTPRGRGRGRGRGGGQGRSFGASPPLPPETYAIGPHMAAAGFTLAEEARQTSQHDHSLWGQDTKLRRKPVSFVSVGTSNPLKEDAESPVENVPTYGPEETQPVSTPLKGDAYQAQQRSIISSPPVAIASENVEQSGRPEPRIKEPFFFDVQRRDTTPRMSKEIKNIERPSSPDSSSSDEVIIFQGRNATKQKTPHAGITLTTMHAEIRAVEKQLPAAAREGHCQGSTESVDDQEIAGTSSRRWGRRRGAAIDIEEDAILADYIANMRENGETIEFPHLQRDLGGTEYYISNTPSPKMECVEDIRVSREPAVAGDKAPDVASEQEHISTGLETGDTNDASDGSPSQSELGDAMARPISSKDAPIDSASDIDDRVSSESDSSDTEHAIEPKHINTDDEFDLMDWERPSLRRKKGKGAQAQLRFDDCDSELEQKLQAAWKNDRMKKSQRKKQREELRALGLLGKNAGPEDLRIKYPTGMSMQQVAEEFKNFLLGTEETLSLPPMDKHARKMVHEFANKFNVKSKSIGKADQRRPTLLRTGRTMPYVESSFDQIVSRINRRFFPRLDVKGKRARGTPARGGHSAATSYRDGEIVGGTAPELGAGNRGRTMLEKMGWSSGTALGATDNKGILQPVTHTMKRTKAGLG